MLEQTDPRFDFCLKLSFLQEKNYKLLVPQFLGAQVLNLDFEATSFKRSENYRLLGFKESVDLRKEQKLCNELISELITPPEEFGL